MKRYARKSRSYTLLEMLAVVGLMGAFLLVSGPLTLHLINATGRRTKIYDQLFLVSQVGDKIRSDLKGLPRPVMAVETNRLLIGSLIKNVEYRTDDKQIERIESLGGISRTTAVWKIPYTSLTFSRAQGSPGAVLVELHWQLGRSGNQSTIPGKLDVVMAFATREPLKQEDKQK